MRVFYSDRFVLPLPEGHRFPMEKYSMLREAVEARGDIAGPGEMLEPHRATDEELLTVHDEGYLKKLVEGGLSSKEIRRIGFPWSEEMVERTRRSSGGTLDACRAALEDGFAANLAGGTHHAFADRGEGFCVTNDSAIAARVLADEGIVRRTVIIDCDVHQGNGTAAILAGDPRAFTFSIHGEKNYPFHKETSDLDVGLPDGTDDGAYLEALDLALEEALDESEADLAIFLAGADPYHDDRFGKLALTKEGLAERDRMVLGACRERGLPVAVAMAGGYARDVRATVEIHLHAVALAAQMAEGLQSEKGAKSGGG
jgi:acetoin utilization deacetylase AcuC-like enzyme